MYEKYVKKYKFKLRVFYIYTDMFSYGNIKYICMSFGSVSPPIYIIVKDMTSLLTAERKLRIWALPL